ncbi:MAG TPA: ABC transporter permease [Vicinamibacteria bacterium]|nr:ABC transporter permease [Vicinamibacteria bacterium]
MALPLAYNVRNVRVRWRLALLAVLGVGAVVAVFAVLMAMSEGFAAALRSTGRDDNAIVVRQGADTERVSEVSLEHRNAILDHARLARGPDGQVLASPERLVGTRLLRRSDGRSTRVTLRGVTPRAFDVRGGIRIVSGRRFRPGLTEVIVGRRIAARARGAEVGGTLRAGRKEFQVVGVFESDGAAFESEIWGDHDVVGGVYKLGAGSNALVVRVPHPSDIPALDRWIRAQPQMPLRAVPERQYYALQAGPMAATLQALAGLVALIMGVGAVFGTMNTMYAIVAARTREIGTLRAMGFTRRAILFSFVVESAVLALLGGVLGCLLAASVHGYSTGTMNLQTLSELAFAFRVTPAIVATSLAFAVIMGIAGGLLPALRAARLSIAGAVREG